MRFRLGMSVPREPALRCEGCRQLLDSKGYHRVTCGRTARLHVRHRGWVNAWRQVFLEAGGQVPKRNVERLLRDTTVTVPAEDLRRLDLVVTGTSLYRGVPLLCDVFCVSPVTGKDQARSGCISRSGGAVGAASSRCHDDDYPEVNRSGVARLCALGVEVFDRWSEDSICIVRALALERCTNLPHRIQRDMQQRLLRR